MSQVASFPVREVVPADEIIRRIVDFCRGAYEHRLPAVVVYHPPHHPCPWPGCEARIFAIDFHLEKMGDEAQHEYLRSAWWLGDGLIGACPSCGQPVLFNVQFKAMANFSLPSTAAPLPDRWHEIARVSFKPNS